LFTPHSATTATAATGYLAALAGAPADETLRGFVLLVACLHPDLLDQLSAEILQIDRGSWRKLLKQRSVLWNSQPGTCLSIPLIVVRILRNTCRTKVSKKIQRGTEM
jgi:hypothetical protein